MTNNVMATYSKEVGGDYPVWIKKGDNLRGGGLVNGPTFLQTLECCKKVQWLSSTVSAS